MNTEQLWTFLSVAETGNFSLSAQRLFVAQSTVSKRIRELEAELGRELLTRGRTGAALTQAGKSLVEYASRILNLEEKAAEEIARVGPCGGRLVISSVYAYYDMYLADMLRRFLEARPEIAVKVTFGHSGQVISECARGSADIAFAHHPFRNPDYICRLVGEDDVLLVTSPKDKKWRDGIPFRAVRELPILASNFLYSATHSWLFPKSQMFRLELDIAARAVPFLKEDGWYTLLPRKMIAGELAAGELVEIPVLGGAIPPVQHYMLLRADSPETATVRAWLDVHSLALKL